MLKIKKTKNRGFTLVELLVTIVIIAILASISVVAYKGIQGRARDAVRAQDIASIKKALLIYEQFHGGLPKTAAYGASLGSGGWDHSQRPEWLAFLSENGKMPVDPSNNYDGIDPGRSGNRVYHYFCYTSPDRVSLRYRKEDNQLVTDVFEVAACLDTLPN